MKSKITIVNIVLITIAAVASLLHAYNVVSISTDVLIILRWLALTGLIIYAFIKKNLTTSILISMLVGTEIGYDFPEIGTSLHFLRQIFLQMIKTVIAPLLFATLVTGIAGHSDLKQVGRMGWKSLLYFEVVTTFALVIGLVFANWFKPGEGIIPPASLNAALPEVKSQTWQDIVLHSFPENMAKSIYHGEVLQIVVFSVLFGIALALLPAVKKEKFVAGVELLAEVMFKFTKIIMLFAPIGVGAAIAETVGHMGIDVLKNLAMLLATLYCALIVFVLLVFVPIALIARIPVIKLAKNIFEPLSIAFATTSSEAALPKAMEKMEKFGVPRQIVAFVMPTGYSFNLDGSTLYLALATVFVAQATGTEMSVGQQITMVFLLMLTSKGVAGIPRATLVILLGAIANFGMPEWPVLLIMGIDELMDMARTTVNVAGNCLATAVVARWEGELDDEKMQNSDKMIEEPVVAEV
ncbi:dicarboxylate/amino acid:cation symporter [Dyadobacter psychrotolerans]|uniref:Cation:dicarboxylase symporter family transporter n=1 Tax=Dyadobacter psychrotolerans TaxID=2541721 RepID=A0A4R5DPP9_9BACT|nr:cation:dicarboxylase symporter family transporter [Dyadobacter psychrotolerans]TDE16316.1 cation:dicarboxylase symporter family transporter [Dyadobacter psychrotolerans]